MYQFSIKKTTFNDKSIFIKSLATQFEQITSVNYEAISHTHN